MKFQVISWFPIFFVIASPVLASPRGWVSPKCTLRTREQRTRKIPYTESYQEHLWGDTYRMQWRTKYKTENYTVVIDEIICCKGYDVAEEFCKPHCTSTCENGYCAKPYSCECDPGFRQLPHDSEKCVPICRDPCVNGRCIADSNCRSGICSPANYCECNDGYEKNDGDVCVPVCNKNCENGECTEVDACDCAAGYEKNSDNFQCLPICGKTCENGVCVAPDICACYEGWKLSKDNYVCEPVCKNCVNGSCISPGNCACSEGYVKDKVDGGTCLPICEPECINGVCSTEGCSCDIGWSGESCEEPLLCDIVEPVDRNVPVTVRLPEVANVPDHIDWKGPTCHPECLKVLGTLTIKFTQINKLSNQHFVPIGSSCNGVSVGSIFPKKYVIPAGAAVGFLSGTSAIAAIIMRKRRMLKSRLEISDRSSQCGSADDYEHADKNFVRMKYRIQREVQNHNESFPYGSSFFPRGSEMI